MIKSSWRKRIFQSKDKDFNLNLHLKILIEFSINFFQTNLLFPYPNKIWRNSNCNNNFFLVF